ncbi:MAG: hypothetical protein E6I62_00225 [Chloroflexi bacterium]|nr:MAG: hypothetical protein E6I62_00225 [Chloroflexota bacterium]
MTLVLFFRDDEAEVRELAARGALVSPADGLVAFSFGAAGTIEREREDRGTLEPRAAAALLALFRGDEAEVRGLAARGAFFLSPADGLVAFCPRGRETRLGMDRPDPAASCCCAVGISPLAESARVGKSVEGSRGPQAEAGGVGVTA